FRMRLRHAVKILFRIELIDLIRTDEMQDMDLLIAVAFERFQLIIAQYDIFVLFHLISFDDLIRFQLSATSGAELSIADPLMGLFAELIEGDAGIPRRAVKPYRNVDQTEGNGLAL